MYDKIYIYDNGKEVRDLVRNYWGHNTKILTEDHIKAMYEGKILAWTDGEYTTSIHLGKEGS